MNKKRILKLLGLVIVAGGTGCQSLKYERYVNLTGREVSGDTGQAYGCLEVVSPTMIKAAPRLGDKWFLQDPVMIAMRGVRATGDPQVDALALKRLELSLRGDDVFVLISSRLQNSDTISGIVVVPRISSVAFDSVTGERWSKVSSYRVIQVNLLANGMLLVDESDRDHELFDAFMYFQGEARQEKLGIWGEDAEKGAKE